MTTADDALQELNHLRRTQIKTKYDQVNLFGLNANILPARS